MTPQEKADMEAAKDYAEEEYADHDGGEAVANDRSIACLAFLAGACHGRASAFEEAGWLCRAWCSFTEKRDGPLDEKFFSMAKSARSGEDKGSG